MDRISKTSILLAKVSLSEIEAQLARTAVKESPTPSAPGSATSSKPLYTMEDARSWVIKACLLIMGGTLIFFLVAPTAGFPLEFTSSLRILEIILPIFLGYIGQSIFLLLHRGTQPMDEQRLVRKSLKLLIQGPIVIFCLALVSIIVAFGLSNRAGAPIGSGITPDGLALSVSIVTAVLTATTNAVVIFLFRH